MAPLFQMLLLFAITSTLLILALVPALLEWYSKSDAQPLTVVREQDTSIRHFAMSFRSQVNTFFDDHGIELSNPPAPFNAVWHVDEPVSFLGENYFPDFSPEEIEHRRINRVLIGSSDMMLPGDMVYEEEIYCCGDLTTGDRTAYRALYSEREIKLGEESVVVRWIHSDADIAVGARSRLFGRLSADRAVTIDPGCEFERISSPVIEFSTSNLNPANEPTAIERTVWEPADNVASIDDRTLKTRSNLLIEANQIVDKNLIVKRRLAFGDNVEIVGDIKADESLKLGAGSIVRGALVCGGPIEIGSGCFIKGPVISESSIAISAGCVIGAPAMPTTVSAPAISIAPGAQVSGSLWAGVSGQVGL